MKIKIKDYLPVVFLLFLIVWIFRAWFSFGPVAAGDWGFFYPQNLKELSWQPFIWNTQDGAALGRINLSHWMTLYFNLLAKTLNIFNLSWPAIERIVWLWPFLILILFSSRYLAKRLFPQNDLVSFPAILIYLFNPYSLMIVGGGQAGVALAYSIAPLVLGIFINSIKIPGLKSKILAGLVLGVQIMFDPRIAYLTLGAVILYAIFQYGFTIRQYLKVFISPFFLALGLNFFWLLPLSLIRRGLVPQGLSGPDWVQFLSFADFSHTLSLLHPNWPENIFGKVYFMRPEFLLIPILAFISLLFTRINTNMAATKQSTTSKLDGAATRIDTNNILFFALLGLLGAFLAKGINPPFGEVYSWLFQYFPGMGMFRDSTKFYILVALSYSVLIPFSLEQLTKQLKRFSLKYLVLSIFVVYWLFLIRPAILGQLGGTFRAKEVPKDYVVLKDFLASQPEFFRTFWIPKRQRFAFYNHNHPAIEDLKLPSKEELEVMGIKYVVIPFDSEGEIFLEDRKYSPQKRKEIEGELDKVSWLKKLKVTDKIAVYETPEYKDHFWTSAQGLVLSWQMINPTKYRVQVKNATIPFELIFSESYDPLWQVKIGKKTISAKPYNQILNSFTIDKPGDFKMEVEFSPQKYVYFGLLVSLLTFFLILTVLLTSRGSLFGRVWRN